METLAERVIRLREAKGWEQKDLVRESGLPQSTVASIEKGDRGKARSPLVELAHVLNVDAHYLKTGEGNPHGSLKLSQDEEILLTAFPHLDEAVKDIWLTSAKKALLSLEASKQKAA